MENGGRIRRPFRTEFRCATHQTQMCLANFQLSLWGRKRRAKLFHLQPRAFPPARGWAEFEGELVEQRLFEADGVW